MWDGSLGEIDATAHRIELTPDAKLVYQPPYRDGPATLPVIGREIAKMREAGVVEQANIE